jgi:hypothetical protein
MLQGMGARGVPGRHEQASKRASRNVELVQTLAVNEKGNAQNDVERRARMKNVRTRT